MDTTKATTHVSLCAGYGGIDLGLRRVIQNLRTIALCEIEAYAVANLVAKMEAGLLDPAPIWPNLKTFPWAAFRDRVDILSGGYPCQPFSSAGKRLGRDDPRHLWPWIADGIDAMRPRLCFFENVEGHITLGLSDVIEDLAGMGYRTTWGIFSASECGAPHQRKRVFILAYSASIGGREDHWIGNPRFAHQADAIWPSRPGEPQHRWEPPRVVADSKKHGWTHQRIAGELDSKTGSEAGRRDQPASPTSDCGDAGTKTMGNADSTRSQEQSRQRGAGLQGTDADSREDAEWQAQPPLGGDPNGASGGMDYAQLCVSCDNRTDELRLLGNGVVPATAALAFKTLIKELI